MRSVRKQTMKPNKEWEESGADVSMPDGITVKQCVEYLSRKLEAIDKSSTARYRAGEAMTVAETRHVSIRAGRSITYMRRLKKLLG
jgi:hypothetical protein